MLRYRAVEHKEGKVALVARAARPRPTATASWPMVAPLANWASDREQHADAADAWRRSPASTATPTLPKYHRPDRSCMRAKRDRPGAHATRRRSAARRCSTPPASSTTTTRDRRGGAGRAGAQRRRDRGRSSRNAAACRSSRPATSPRSPPRRKTSPPRSALDRQGLRHRRAVPSCALMLKFEWPLILPEDPAIKRLSAATFDIANTSSTSPRRRAWRPGCSRSTAASRLHLACHARAQNMGAESGRDAAADPRGQGRRDRALLRPRRHLGRHEGEFRHRA